MTHYLHRVYCSTVHGVYEPEFESIPPPLMYEGHLVHHATLAQYLSIVEGMEFCLPGGAPTQSTKDIIRALMIVRLMDAGAQIRDVEISDSRPTGDRDVWARWSGYVFAHPVVSRDHAGRRVRLAYANPVAGRFWHFACALVLPLGTECATSEGESIDKPRSGLA